MSEFKVGDRVRRINTHNHPVREQIGCTAVIESLSNGWAVVILDETNRRSEWLVHNMELVTKEAKDDVNQPSHYTSHPSGIECIQVVEHMTFNCGNVIKYIWRNGLKEGQPALKDLKKALYYMQREVNRIEKGEKK